MNGITRNTFQSSRAFLSELIERRHIVFELTKRDLVARYRGSVLGFVWAYLEPLSYLLVLWVVFSTLRAGSSLGGYPMIVTFVTGLIPWTFFTQNLNHITLSIISYQFLLSKTPFSLGLLPIVKVLSNTLAHGVLIAFAIFICLLNGVTIDFFVFQLFYYYFAMFMLLLGFGWITSSLNVFVRDVTNVVAIFIQIGFFLTPILWSMDRVADEKKWMIMINPVVYIINGYRDSILHKVPFWEHPIYTAYFWTLTITLLILGSSIFRRLRPHFAEVI